MLDELFFHEVGKEGEERISGRNREEEMIEKRKIGEKVERKEEEGGKRVEVKREEREEEGGGGEGRRKGEGMVR